MSALCLFWSFDGARDAKPSAARMLSSLRPHGPDHQALWSDGPVAMGRALTRIVPEDAYDRGPILVREGKAVVAVDGRIDNRGELADALGITPERARVMPDAEFGARAWEQWGDACLPRLLGDFSLMVWDGESRRVFCARDALGKRQLVYCRGLDFLAIASMPKGLLALPEVPRAVDVDMLGMFLALLPVSGEGNPSETQTFFGGIERLPPATWMSFTVEGQRIGRHWRPEDVTPVRHRRDSDYLDHARATFAEAVRVRLRSVGPVGSHLSAGLDSASVVATAAPLLAERGERLTAYTGVPRPEDVPWGPRTMISDEGPLAAETARCFANVDHVRVEYPMESPLDAIGKGLTAFDEPIRNPTNLGFFQAINAEAERRGTRTMLYGAMGNATLSYMGLERLNLLLSEGRLVQWAYETIQFARLEPGSWGERFKRQIMLALPARLREDINTRFGWQGRDISSHSPLSESFIRDRQLDERRSKRLRVWSNRRMDRGWRARMIAFADPAAYNAGVLARYRVDLRDPTADRRFVDFCLGLPLDQYFRHGEQRLLVRRMMQGRLPDAVMREPRKGMQGVGWLANLRFGQADVLAEIRAARSSPTASRMLDLDRLERLALKIPGERPEDAATRNEYQAMLLRGAAAARFIRHVEGGNG